MGVSQRLAIGLLALGVPGVVVAITILFGWPWALLVVSIGAIALGLEESLR